MMGNVKSISNGGDNRDMATAALINAIALYKACGWSAEQMQHATMALWGDAANNAGTGQVFASAVAVDVTFTPVTALPSVIHQEILTGVYGDEKFEVWRSYPNGTEWQVRLGTGAAIFGLNDVFQEVLETLIQNKNKAPANDH